MIIAGLVKTSLIDYPGKVAAIVFTFGCNFRCGYCHNPDLIIKKKQNSVAISEKEFFDFLNKRRKVLDGVCVTGGEPLLNSNILNFLKKIKDLGLLVKLDTNGSNPMALKKAIDSGFIDYVAMDIKNSLDKYKITVNLSVAPEDIKKSINEIMASGLDYEFRSTIMPFFHTKDDFEKMGQLIEGAKRFYIQGVRTGIILDKALEGEKGFSSTKLKEIQKIFSKYVDNVHIRDNL